MPISGRAEIYDAHEDVQPYSMAVARLYPSEMSDDQLLEMGHTLTRSAARW